MSAFEKKQVCFRFAQSGLLISSDRVLQGLSAIDNFVFEPYRKLYDGYASWSCVVAELRRYFAVRLLNPNDLVPLPLPDVDKLWHLMICSDTRRYTDFCQMVFGQYLHHTSGHFLRIRGEEASGEYEHYYVPLFGELMPAEASGQRLYGYDEMGNCA